jgi:TatD DNase family protein
MSISKNGRAIIKEIPRNRILTESDAPFNNKADIKEALINMHITENEVKKNFMELLSKI